METFIIQTSCLEYCSATALILWTLASPFKNVHYLFWWVRKSFKSNFVMSIFPEMSITSLYRVVPVTMEYCFCFLRLRNITWVNYFLVSGKIDNDTVAFCERFVELLIDLEVWKVLKLVLPFDITLFSDWLKKWNMRKLDISSRAQ